MAKINLLPWRQELRKEQQRQFFTVMGLMTVLVLLGIVAVHLQYSRLISNQNERNSYLQREIKAVEKQIREIDELASQKNRLLARMNVIQQLQQNRPEIVRLFSEMVRVIPEGVHITKLTQNNKNLSMSGQAQSNARVSAFMRNIDESSWLGNPQLGQIAGTGPGTRTFTMQAQQVNKADAAAQGN